MKPLLASLSLRRRVLVYFAPLTILPMAATLLLEHLIRTHHIVPTDGLSSALVGLQPWISIGVVVWGVMLVTLALCVVLADSMTAPIREVVMFAKRLARGERNITLKTTVSHDVESTQLIEAMQHLGTQLLQYEQQLQQQSADATKGEMATQMAHDMRSPISVVLAVMRPIRNASASPAHAELCDSVETAAQKLNTMADDLLEVARAKRITAMQTDLAALVRSAVRQVERTLEDRDVTLQYAGVEECIAEVDRDKLDRVLTNLTQNAVQAIPAERSGEVCVEMVDEVTHVAIHIRDNGSGITLEHQSRLFEKFFTTKGKHGNGIGLAYCKEVIEAHGGVLTVKSEVGIGTCFTMRLPKQVAEGASLIEKKSTSPLRVVGT